MKRSRTLGSILTAAAVALGIVALAAPASADTACTQLAAGVRYTATYTSTAPDGVVRTGSSLATVSRAGASVEARVTVTALPAGATCVDLALAAYRTPTITFVPDAYQELYSSAVATEVGVGDTVALAVTVPQTPGIPGPGCTNTHSLEQNGNGANVPGPYDTTCDGTASGNGQGKGKAGGKPCAGCVGNADNKNPPGQLPGPQDGNAGYECDRNQGIAKGNPAHSGCAAGTFWQVDLVTGEVLAYVGDPRDGGPVERYGPLGSATNRLLAFARG